MSHAISGLGIITNNDQIAKQKIQYIQIIIIISKNQKLLLLFLITTSFKPHAILNININIPITMAIGNHTFLTSFLLLFAFCALFASVTEAGSEDDSIFHAVREDKDDGAAIRSWVEKDPSLLESIGSGGQTPLIHAVLQGKIHSVQTLLELGADTSATEKDGYNVLHAAGFQGRGEILQLLLDHFSANGLAMDPSTDQHTDGYYPLHVRLSFFVHSDCIAFVSSFFQLVCFCSFYFFNFFTKQRQQTFLIPYFTCAFHHKPLTTVKASVLGPGVSPCGDSQGHVEERCAV